MSLIDSRSKNREVVLRSVLQTYDHFLERSYKGLDIDQSVPVQKALPGRVGIAMGYKNLEEPKETN